MQYEWTRNQGGDKMCFFFLSYFQIETVDRLTNLTIYKSHPEDTGLITCRAKNHVGTAECSAELYVQREYLKTQKKIVPIAYSLIMYKQLVCQWYTCQFNKFSILSNVNLKTE